MQTIELERSYRAACQKMLASLDLRAALNRVNEEIVALHQLLTVEGARILSDPANDDSLARYRTLVEKVVSKLDERDQLRQRDAFKEALQDLLQLGEQLGYARKAEPSYNKAEPPYNKAEPAQTMLEPVLLGTLPDPVRSDGSHNGLSEAKPPAQMKPELVRSPVESGFSAVERELAGLQQQLAEIQRG